MATEAFDQQAAREYFQGREIRLYGTQPAGFDGLTTNRQDYIRHPLEARPDGRHVQYTGACIYALARLSVLLASRALFPKPRGRMIAHPHKLPLITRSGNNVPFDGTSTYNSHYQQMPLPERAHAPPAQYQPTPAVFDGGCIRVIAWEVLVRGTLPFPPSAPYSHADSFPAAAAWRMVHD